MASDLSFDERLALAQQNTETEPLFSIDFPIPDDTDASGDTARRFVFFGALYGYTASAYIQRELADEAPEFRLRVLNKVLYRFTEAAEKQTALTAFATLFHHDMEAFAKATVDHMAEKVRTEDSRFDAAKESVFQG